MFSNVLLYSKSNFCSMILDEQKHIYLVIEKSAKKYLIFKVENQKNVPPVKFTKCELVQFCVKVTIGLIWK